MNLIYFRKTALLLSLFLISWGIQAQSKKLSLDYKNTALSLVLEGIEKQLNKSFFYEDNLIQPTDIVSISVKNTDLKNVIDILFNKTISCSETDLHIVLKKVQKEDIVRSGNNTPTSSTGVRDTEQSPASGTPKSRNTVRGVVKDESGEALPGAFISVLGDNKLHATTNILGEFALEGFDQSAVLQISFIGYPSTEIAWNGASDLHIVLKQSAIQIDAAVIIGYGKTTTRMNTGSVSSLTGRALSDQSVGEPIGALQGRVSGLFISSSNGLPGANYTVQLRGINSISGSNPLYIVDGVPFMSESLNQFAGANGNQSPLSSINSSDIDRIDVLKDADATAIYGSRGANGVILITTKSGKAGKTKVDFSLYSGIAQVPRKVSMLSPDQYYTIRNEAFTNDGVVPNSENAPDLLVWDKSKTTDWQKYLIGNTANLTEARVAVSGGNEQTNFLLSGTYRYENTVFPSSMGYNRGAALLSVNHKSKDNKFNLTTSVSYSSDNNESGPTDLTQYYNLPPDIPLYNADGSFYWYGNAQNPAALLNRTYNSKTNSLIGNVTAKYTILKGLDAKVNLGYTRTSMDQIQTYPEAGLNPTTSSGSFAYYGASHASSYIVEPQVTYDIDLGQSKLSFLLGTTWQESVKQGSSLLGEGYSNDGLLENMQSAASLTVRGSSYQQYNYESVFGRINYGWKEKYLLNATFRRDGSSRFGPGKRFGNFGAIGAAWIFSGESFISDNLSFMSFGKLRTSYGITGNDQIGDYGYLDSWESTTFPYDGISGLAPARLYNNNYSWEESRKLEIGLELGFFNNRIFLKTDYYSNRSDNQLIDFALSPQTGFNSYRANLPALVGNSGWEFDLSTTIIQNSSFHWDLGLNLTLAKNELLEYPDLENSSYADQYVIGQPLDIVKGYHFTGVNTQTGIAQFYDINGDGVITSPNDDVILGSRMPPAYGGLNSTLRYKNLSLSFLLQFVKQDGPSINYGYMAYPNGIMSNSTSEALNRWQKPGDITATPMVSRTSGKEAYDTYNAAYRFSDAVWGDASYIRLKNITINYNLSNWAKRLKMSELNIYIQAQNLFTVTNYIGFDPETQGLSLPPLRTITAGIRFSL